MEETKRAEKGIAKKGDEMTAKQTITLDIDEIRTLEVRCNNCPGCVQYPIGYSVPNFLNCPGCGVNLIDDGPIYSALFKLHAALAEWGRVHSKRLRATFTVDDPEEVSSRDTHA